jgi:DNA topoisomerase-1
LVDFRESILILSDMSKNLVIVESPAKAKTISKFLDKNYTVLASMGHVRDLPKSKMGIDVEGDFEATYLIPQDKKKTIKELKSKLKSDTTLWLATDHDREGEAIAWHLLQALEVKKQPVHRIAFHEITKSAILEAIANPQTLNQDLINAQQARRILDRLVGYELSPLLWKKIRYGLSAGRVQSVALRLVVERERERNAFKSEEYWSITGTFYPEGSAKEVFTAKLTQHAGKPLTLSDETSARGAEAALKDRKYHVQSVERKEVRRNPAPPFITSTLQQEAARKLHMSVKKTMTLAQQLYEGVDVGEGTQGLITYMRTDSVNLATQATTAMREFIVKQYGKEYALATPRQYKSKKGAQEAHEAVRPVDITLTPDSLKSYLDKDQLRLYELIWKRALASQMEAAVLDRVSVDLQDESSEYTFRATGQTVRFSGFIQLYVEGTDEPAEDDQAEGLLPQLSEGQAVVADAFDTQQHFTQPPARYTEASLVKRLEAEGIGRPSTYAPTISTILAREYVKKEGTALFPTDVGNVVTDVLVEHFPTIVDVQFTAKMEDDLDNIAEGKEEWHAFLKAFYSPFHANVLEKQKTLKKEEVVTETTDEICELCGKPMIVKLGRYGKFLSCSDYPKCKNARPLEENKKEDTPEFLELQKKLAGKVCPKCGKPMEVKKGRYGEFLGCTGYPACRQMQPIVKFTGVKCPECKEGQLVERRTRKGARIFYGCNKFPKCKFASWDKPLEGACKQCESLRVQKGDKMVCSKCGVEG